MEFIKTGEVKFDESLRGLSTKSDHYGPKFGNNVDSSMISKRLLRILNDRVLPHEWATMPIKTFPEVIAQSAPAQNNGDLLFAAMHTK